MSTSRFAKLTRGFLYLLIASICLGAVLAMGIVVAGNWSWFEVRILLTTGTVAGASICGMASGAALSRRGSPAVPIIGIGLAGLGAIALIAGMWFETGSGDYWRFTASVCIFAVTAAHLAVLSLARLQPPHAWLTAVASAASMAFGIILVLLITSQTGGDEGMVRLLAAVGIGDVAFSLVVPIVHLLDRRAIIPASAAAYDLAVIDEEIVRLQAQIDELQRRRAALLGDEAVAGTAR